MKNQSPSRHIIGPKTPFIENPNRDKPIPIREWQQQFESHLIAMGKKSTRERYSRALERFLGNHPGKKYAHQFQRPVINSYVETRLGEGASVATVRLELAAIRGLFQFALHCGAADVFFNPARNVKVKQPKKPARIGENQASEAMA